ncbi:hypothetical protein [Romboutsia sp.]|uniref:hypothetical protein n=1 Tax=Romboutsia sp. TaxID=1965302 RepID=UPI002BB50F02|nr:hypothetical protein [Romboutsia sp.]HSQ88984.1 hypothetical protein [Romboutsia sp.]
MSKKVACGGLLLSINIILLLLINVIPINTLFLMGLASLPISIVIMEWGPKSGFAFYIASVVLGFIVMANKTHWIIYILTFGIYGIVKYIIEQDRLIYIEYLLKILFANMIMILLYFLLRPFVYIPINIATVIAFEVVFIVYDHIYTTFIKNYNQKLRKIIKSI